MPRGVTTVVEDGTNLLRLSEAEFCRAIRRRSIGGTYASAILGLSRWMTPVDAWRSLMGVREPARMNADMQRGIVLEPIIADIYAEQTGRGLLRARHLRHPARSWVKGSPDRLIGGDHESDGLRAPAPGRGVLEIKCLRQQGFARTLREGVDPGYYAQLQHYLYAGDMAWGSFAIFNAEDWRLHWFDVIRDDPFIEEMEEIIRRFWSEHVLTRIPPDGSIPEIAVPDAGVRGVDSVSVEGEPVWEGLMHRLKTAREEFELRKLQKERIEAEIKGAIERAGLEKIHGYGVRIRYAEQTRRNFDRAALTEAHPEIDLSPYFRQTVTRPFNVTIDGQEEDA